jgi:tripartite-type tricarboxylate transporter receptor subunit TctC
LVYAGIPAARRLASPFGIRGNASGLHTLQEVSLVNHPTVVMWLMIAVGALAAPASGSVSAADYPTKPIKIVVPVGAGSASDVRARQIAERLSKALGQPVIVDNRPGAASTIGAAYVATSKPDGYTLLYGTIADQAIAPSLFKELPYNPRKDFVPVAQNSLIPPILVINPGLGVNTIQELIALAKRKPGRLAVGSWGEASITHILGRQLALEAGIELVHVPYKNAAAALTDVAAGHIAMMFDYTPTCKPLIDAGRIKALMTVGDKRSKILPQVPSAAEVGLPALRHMGWSAMFVPAGTSPEIVKRLNVELVKIVRSPAILQIIVDSGGDPDAVGGTPEQIAAFVRREQDSLADLVKATGVEVQ